jgi:hypothetical protein
MWQLLIQIFKSLLKQLELKLNLDLKKLKGALCIFSNPNLQPKFVW